MPKRIVLLLFLFGCLSGALSLCSAGVDKATRMTLRNGLEVILVENHASPIISSNVFIRTGSSKETPAMNGATHLLEHLLFNGTERRTQKELYDEVDFLGAYNNAFTREDFTCFQMIVSSALLRRSLDIQSDMLFNSTVTEGNFEKEKKIVIEEIGKERGNPDYLAELFFIGKAFEGTPYAKPVLGTVESITEMKRDDVFDYYKQYFVPNNMVLFLVGDFDPDDALEAVKEYFGSASKRKFAKSAGSRISLKRDMNLFRSRIEAGRDYLEIITGGPDLESPDFIPFQIILSILADGEDSRLSKALKERGEDLVLDFSLTDSIHGGQGLIHFSATLPQAVSAERVAEIYFRELRRIAAEGIGEDEIERAKKDLRISEIYQEEQFHYYSVMRGQWIAFARPGYLENYLLYLEKQNAGMVNAVAKRYLKEMEPVVTVAGAKQADGAAEKYSIPEYPAEDALAADDGVRKEILDNGLTIIARQDSSANIFAAHFLMKNRSLGEPDGKTGIADFTHRMLMKGTALIDPAGISEALKEAGARIKIVDDPFIPYDDYYTTPLYSFIRFEVLPEDRRKGMKLLEQIVFHPSFPEAEIQKTAAEMGNLIRKNEEKASARAKNLFYAKVLGGSKLGNPVYGSSETIRSVTRDDLLSFHRSYFSPGNILVSVVSNIPAGEVIRDMKEIFGDLKAIEEKPASTPEVPPTTGWGKFETTGGKEQSYVYAGYMFRPKEDDLPALMIANAILSDRMAFDLREKQGLAYSLGSSLSFYGDSMLFMASIGTRPENIENAISGIYKEIEAFADAELTTKELEKTVNSIIGRSVMRRISGINRAYFIGLSEFQGRGLDFDLDLIGKMKVVGPEAVKQAARKYLQTSNIILVIAR